MVAPFWLIQLAHSAAIEATLKDLLLQIHVASIASSDSVLSVSLSTSQVEVRSTMGLQIVVHAVGTSLLSSSSASTGPIMIVEKITRLARRRASTVATTSAAAARAGTITRAIAGAARTIARTTARTSTGAGAVAGAGAGAGVVLAMLTNDEQGLNIFKFLL